MFEGCNILFQLFYNVFHRRRITKWKVEDLRKYLLQRGVPIGNNAHKANLIEKVIFAQKLDLPIQPSQEERENGKGNFKCEAQQIEH